MATKVQYKPIAVNVGAPTVTINFYTRSKSYELHSKIGDPNTSILNVNTSKDLSSPSGSFTISLVPETDKEGRTWKDKLQVFDYVEIYMKGGADGEVERIIMRGLIDSISTDEDFSGDVPQRSITVSGRDLGALFSDFSVWYSPLLDQVAAIAKMSLWRKSRETFYTMESLFKEFLDYMTTMLEITVGKPTYLPDDLKRRPTDKETGIVVGPPTTINLATKIQYKVKGFFPDLITMYSGQMEILEGAWWNLFQNYQDKPFHEMFIWDDVDATNFILRPGRLYDMKKNYHQNVEKAIQEMGPSAYPPDFPIKNEDKISISVRNSISQLYNNFFTYAETDGIAKSNFLAMAVFGYEDNPAESVNPFFSLRPKTSFGGEGVRSKEGEEPIAYIQRYGLRKYEVPIHFFELDIGQIKQAETKDPDHPAQPKPVLPKWKNLPVEDGEGKRIEVSKWEDKVEKYSQKNNADKPLVYSILDKSSGGDELKTHNNYNSYNPTIVSSTDTGLMQINDKTMVPAYTGGTDPDQNLDYGTARIGRLEQKYGGDKRKVIAAYKDERVVDRAITKAAPGTDWFSQLPEAAKPNDGKALQKWTNETQSLYNSYDEKLKVKSQYTGSPDVKQAQVDSEASSSRSAMDLLKDPFIGPALKYNFILVCWYLHNHYLLDGSISIRGTNKAIIGTYVQDKDGEYFDLSGKPQKGMEYYVEGVSHNFAVFSRYITTLTVTRGQPEVGGLFGQGYKGKWYFDEGVVPTSFQNKALPPPPPAKTPIPKEGQPKASKGFVRLPDETATCGYHYYGNEAVRWGKPETIEAIKAAGVQWQATHPYPTYPRLCIGDISLEFGGPIPPHESHRNGDNFDMRPVRLDNKEVPCSRFTTSAYSQTRTQEGVNIIRGNGIRNVRTVLFNDKTVAGTKLWAGHDDHLHVTFG